jgi:hypothetical protein
VCKHLVVLERAGLVSRRNQSREVLHQVQADTLEQATLAMADLAAQWDRRLAAIKRLAEASARRRQDEAKPEPQHEQKTVMECVSVLGGRRLPTRRA